jgi:hypothetical protein
MEPQQKNKKKCTILWDMTPCRPVDDHRNHYENFSRADKPAGQFVLTELDAEHVARMGEKRNAYRVMLGKPEGKRPLGRSKHKWLDDIKLILGGMCWYGFD